MEKNIMDFQTLVMRCLSDPDFTQALLENPEDALSKEGIKPTREMIEALKEIDADAIKRLAIAFNKTPGPGPVSFN